MCTFGVRGLSCGTLENVAGEGKKKENFRRGPAEGRSGGGGSSGVGSRTGGSQAGGLGAGGNVEGVQERGRGVRRRK